MRPSLYLSKHSHVLIATLAGNVPMGKIEFRKAIALFPATSGKRQKTISDPGVVVVFAAVFVEELLQKAAAQGRVGACDETDSV